MSLPTRARILPSRMPVPVGDLDDFSQAFRAAARERDLTVRQACRYEAWTLAFLDWCCEEPARQMSPDQIDAFRTALQDRAQVGEEAVCEAMDALAFFFGAAQEAGEILASVRPGEATPDENTSLRASRSEGELQTLEVGWQNGNAGAHGASEPPSQAKRKRNEPSTADLCIERFQTQLDTLHSTEADSGEAEREAEIQ